MNKPPQTQTANVSVVVPAYNAERFLAETLIGVQNQTHRHWELVVVDDGSTDHTAMLAQEQAQRDSRMRVFSQPNGGVSAARNYGFAQTCQTSEYVIFLDADDVWQPNALETLIAALQASPQAVAAHGAARFMYDKGMPIRPGKHEAYALRRCAVSEGQLTLLPETAPTTFAALSYRNCVPSGGILLRREAKKQAGAFDPALSPAEDWDMWLRMSLLGEIAFVPQIVYRYRQHGSASSQNVAAMRRAEERVRESLLARLDNSQRKAALSAFAFDRQTLCRELIRGAVFLLRQRRLRQAAGTFRHAAQANAQRRRWAALARSYHSVLRTKGIF